MSPFALIFLAAFLAVARTGDAKSTPAPAPGKTTGKEPAVTEKPATIKPPLECQCQGSDCKGETTVKCAADQDVCFNVIETLVLDADDLTFQNDVKGCAKSGDSFNGSFYLDFGRGVQLDMTSKLCRSTECYASPESPWIRNLPNGQECPLCYKTGQSSCTSNDTVLCRGDMINCTTVSGVIIEGEHSILFAAQGCTTSSVCDIGKRNSPVRFPSGSLTIQFNNVTCSSGSPASLLHLVPTLGSYNLGAHVAFFLPSLLGLLTVKTFSS